MKYKSIIIVIFIAVLNSVNAQINHWETVVYSNGIWHYFEGVREPAADWPSLSFDDSAWKSGRGGVGYGDDDDGTVIDPVLSVYLRKEFTIYDLNKIEKAILHIDYDDAFVAYLNGTEIARDNVNGYPPAHDTPANGNHEAQIYEGGMPSSYVFSREKFRLLAKTGKNVLAIQVHNLSMTSSDMSSNAFLSVAVNDDSRSYGDLPDWFDVPEAFDNSNLPVFVINTFGQSIVDEPRVESDLIVYYNDNDERNSMITSTPHFDGSIGIELRGKSSQGFPKKNYRIELHDDQGEDLDFPLLGLPENDDWTLHGPHTDKTLMRNVLTYHIANQMGQYAPRTRFCELILNDEYLGVYVLIEKIERDKNRVDIAKLDSSEVSGDDVTGGYILRLDVTPGNPDEYWTSRRGGKYLYYYPKPGKIVSEQKSYIQNYIEEFETAISRPFNNGVVQNYHQYVDLNTFVDYVIVNELGRNVDGYFRSTYLYKDKNSKDGRLKAGPLWDFNFSFGNPDYRDSFNIAGWNLVYFSTYPFRGNEYWPYWWKTIWDDPQFQQKLFERWQDLRQDVLKTDRLLNYIDAVADTLNEAQVRNFKRWDVLGRYLWPNAFVGDTYQEEIDYMKDWISDRMDWMDDNIHDLGISDTTEGTAALPADNAVLQNYPNPFNPETVITYQLTVKSPVQLTVYNIRGEKVAELVNASQNAGTYSYTFSGAALGSGLYFYQLKTEKRIRTGKMILNR